jgi:hypothetical protein
MADFGLLNKETRNAGEKPVHGFMGSLLNPNGDGLDFGLLLAGTRRRRADLLNSVFNPCFICG